MCQRLPDCVGTSGLHIADDADDRCGGESAASRGPACKVISICHVGSAEQAPHIAAEFPPAKSDDLTTSRLITLPSFPCPIPIMAEKIVTFDDLKANSSKDSLYILIHQKGQSSPSQWESARLYSHCPTQSTTSQNSSMRYDSFVSGHGPGIVS